MEALPGWMPTYLAAWGSTRPDGKAMSVEWAAGLAGVSPSAVRNWRAKDRRFQTLEYVARHGGAAFMASYADAGVRAAAPRILGAFLGLVDEGNATAILQGMKWLLGKADAVVHVRGGLEFSDVSDDELAAIQEALAEGAGSPGSGGEAG